MSELNLWGVALQKNARSEYREFEMNSIIDSYSPDELGVQIFNLAAKAVNIHVYKHGLHIKMLKQASQQVHFSTLAERTGATYYYDYESVWNKHFSKGGPPPANPAFYPYGNRRQTTPNYDNPSCESLLTGVVDSARCSDFYKANDVDIIPPQPPVEGRWMTKVISGSKRGILTDIQLPDGPFEVYFETDDLTFFVMMESDGDKKPIGESNSLEIEDYAWAHAKKLMQSIDINNSMSEQHNNDAFFVRMNVCYGELDQTVTATTPDMAVARQYLRHLRELFYASVDVWTNIVKKICQRLHKPGGSGNAGVPRLSHTYWINYSCPRHDNSRRTLSCRSWNHVLDDTNHENQDDYFRPSTYFGAYRSKRLQTKIRALPPDRPALRVRYGAHMRTLVTIHVQTIRLPGEADVSFVRNFRNSRRDREKIAAGQQFLWCVPDLYKLALDKTNQEVDRQYINWATGNPLIDNQYLLPIDAGYGAHDCNPAHQRIAYEQRVSNAGGAVPLYKYYDLAIFRFLEFIIHVQQYQLVEIWQEFEYRPQGQGQAAWKQLSEAKKTYNRIVLNDPTSLVNRSNIVLDADQYPNALPWRRSSKNLGAMLFRSAHQTLPLLDPRLATYIRQMNMVGAELLLRKMRCTNLAVLQETARQYEHGNEALKGKIETLLKQYPACSESELRWLFSNILKHPITLV